MPVADKGNTIHYYLIFIDLSCGHRAESLLQLTEVQHNEFSYTINMHRWAHCPKCKQHRTVIKYSSLLIQEWDIDETQIGVSIRKEIRGFFDKP